MEQKFIKLEDAAEKLGVSPDRLNDLRESGQLRAYRDGPSWKFRTDEIERMSEEGLPELPQDSDIGFGLLDDEELAPLVAEDSGPELDLEGTDPVSAGSELELDDLEDTVTAGASDVLLAATPEEPSDLSDSILLSDEELGESAGPSASTIVGKDVLDADADLELASDSKSSNIPSAAPGASNVLSSDSASDDVLDSLELENSAAGASGFEDLEELEIDLAAESSRILSPDELSKAQAAASLPVSDQGDSDLALDDGLTGSDVDSEMGSTDIPLLETGSSSSPVEGGSGSEIDLATDDDLVLSGSGDSDITLGSSDSGINLAPADSGLALDDIPLEIGGSAILSSLDLGGDSDPEISLVGSAPEASEAPEAELEIEEDFQLTPLSQGSAVDDGDSSSQVIALDADIDDLEQDVLGDDVGVLDEDVDFTEDGGDVMIADDFGAAADGDLEMGTYAGAGTAAVSAELPYSVGQVIGLGSCAVMMALGGIMMLDMIRNIWSWNEPYSLSSTLIESILGLF